ncbi:MAG: hypothetical protein HY361_05490 [Candidatus Aenigmarchaeota archaeon]|nr:hypothetical protein [Candidatus Aenigmarchaeota archaeon]
MGISPQKNRILLATIILVTFSFITLANAQAEIPENVTTESISFTEFLSGNQFKISIIALHTNPTSETKVIKLSDGLVFNFQNTNLTESDISIKQKYKYKELPFHTRGNYTLLNFIIDVHFILIDPYNDNWIGIEYIERKNLTEDIDNFFIQRKTVSYKIATIEAVNSYSHTLKIPKKDFPFNYFWKVRLVDSLMPPDNFYESGGYYEYVWKTDRKYEKTVYVIPIQLTFEYYFDFDAVWEFIFGSVVFVILVDKFSQSLPKIYRKLKELLKR